MNNSSILIVLIIMIVVIVSLLVVVVNQNKKINDLQKPKYGFLGKTLSLFVSLSFLATSGFFLYQTFFPTTGDLPPGVDVGSKEYEVQIIYEVVDSPTKTYKFNVVPIVNNVAWGGTDDLKIDVIWTFTSDTSETVNELQLSRTTPGGVIKKLSTGQNFIEAKFIIENKEFSKQIMLTLTD